MTTNPISATPPAVGRRKINFEQYPAKFPEGTLSRARALLSKGEKFADMLREAVEREIRRRIAKRESRRKPPRP